MTDIINFTTDCKPIPETIDAPRQLTAPKNMFRNSAPTRRIRKTTKRWPSRTAAAVVEFAVLLPVMVVLVFGSIEMANGIFLKQAIAVAAYEGARTAARTTGTEPAVQARIDEVLTARSISNETVTISPSLTSVTRGTQITVTVSVPSSELGSVLPLQYLKNKTISRSVTMVRQ